jgi:hypothetical protein
MTLAKSILTFIISSIFVLFLYMTINSYTLGNTLQKDNIGTLFSSQLTGGIASSDCQNMCESQINSDSCSNSCSYLRLDMQPYCIESCQNSTHDSMMQICLQNCFSRFNQTQRQISEAIDGLYGNEIASGVTINDVANVFSNNLLLIVITLLSGASLLVVAEKPVSKLGSNILWVSISILTLALVPIVVINPDDSIFKMVFEYLFASMYQQAIIGVILLVVGIALLLTGRKFKK